MRSAGPTNGAQKIAASSFWPHRFFPLQRQLYWSLATQVVETWGADDAGGRHQLPSAWTFTCSPEMHQCRMLVPGAESVSNRASNGNEFSHPYARGWEYSTKICLGIGGKQNQFMRPTT